MQPKNKFQQQVLEISKRLPKITVQQKRWAFKHCFEHIGKCYSNGKIVCLECGHSWSVDNKLFEDSSVKLRCPHCTTLLDIKTSRQRVFKEDEYFGVVTTCEGFQVIRYFYMSVCRKATESARYSCSEVVQRWLSPNGKEAVIARLRGMSCMYYDLWAFGSPLEIRPYHRAHDINPIRFYPRQSVISKVSRNGFCGEYHDIHPYSLFRSILTNNKAETLLKSGQYKLLKHFVDSSSLQNIDHYWNSIRICIRNSYTIEDGAIWCDYIDQLSFFDKDTNSPKYVCPDNLQEQHDLYMRKKRTFVERQRLEEKRQKARENEAKFRELKARFFGIAFTDGTIQVQVLESVDEFMEEGNAMHHCVFDNSYYLRENSLIFSATINGQRIETVEVSLKTLQVVQSRGVCNQNTIYHDQIVRLVNQNMKLIQERLIA